MKRFNYFTLMMLSLGAMTACNEKISPKLLEGNQSTTVVPVIEPSEYFINITNTSPATRKYNLHKSGSGNFAKKCEIRGTEKFSSSLYQDSSRYGDFDISCYFEAEELSLSQFGFSFKFEASANTCDYVAYAPFSFFNLKPGDSTGHLERVVCGEGAASPGPLGCGQMRDTALLDPLAPNYTNASFTTPEKDEDLCRYNYEKSKGPNCDIGKITITETEYTLDATTGNSIPSTSTKTIECGGAVSNCINGPIKQEENFEAEWTSGVVIYETEKNTPFSGKREYTALKNPQNNLYYANFRRDLANKEIDYGDRTVDIARYRMHFAGETEIQTNLMENYSAGLLFNTPHPYSDSRADRKTKGLAAEPFMGLDGYRTTPFYTVYCLNSAQEVRARIKMMVRDWDQSFINASDFDLITDVDRDADARMDLIPDPDGEVPGDGDVFNPKNDRADWDDQIPMARPLGSYNPLLTTWSPSLGFFNNALWPKFIKDK